MSKQQKLFGGEAEASKPRPKPRPRSPIIQLSSGALIDPETLDKTPNDEYLERIRNEMYLWDMRCWDERSREEAAKWVKLLKEGGRDWKNCGHATYCIQKLLRRGVDESIILDAIMDNDRIQYRNRLVKCFGGPMREDFRDHPCPKAREVGSYAGDFCRDCENPKDVERNFARPRRTRLEASKILGGDPVDEDKDEGLAEETSGTGAGKQQ